MTLHASDLALGTLGIAVLLVALNSLWRVAAGPFVVLIEQVGHTVAILLTGRWVSQVQLERGKEEPHGFTHRSRNDDQDPFKPPRVVYHLAGYSAPPVVGLVLARGVDRGWDPATVLATLLFVVGVVIVFHKKVYTLVVVVGVGLVLALFFWLAGHTAQGGAVVALSWVLLVGALRRGVYLIGTKNPTDATALGEADRSS